MAALAHNGHSVMPACQKCCADEEKPDSSQDHISFLNSKQPVTFDLGSPGEAPSAHSPPSCPSLHHPICQQHYPLLCPRPPLVSPSGLRSWVWQGQGWGPGQAVLGIRGSLSSHRKVSEQGRGGWGRGELTRELDPILSHVPITIPGAARHEQFLGASTPKPAQSLMKAV